MSDPEQIAPGAASNRQNWKLILAYDGTDFHGWQVQPGKPTIQGELQAALSRVTGESPLPQGSGRTDAGVHALAQVASFFLTAPIPPENLRRALNRTLPSSIRIAEAKIEQSASFHARHSAIAKIYEYRILRSELCSPFMSRYVYHCPWPLDFHSLEQSASLFVGEHDFLSFAATDPDVTARTSWLESEFSPSQEAPSTVRTILSSSWQRHTSDGGELWVYRVRGNGFLHHMVRNLVGTMLESGRGHFPPDRITEILAARSRPAAGPTAPARGLFLHSVEYSDEYRDEKANRDNRQFQVDCVSPPISLLP
jgi:tRNA pseudouridine38-40 synthase